jgi:uncharacterized membrane-anchored protein
MHRLIAPSKSNNLRKVPQITLLFWLVKLLTTAMGESFSDYLVVKINPYIAVTLGAIALLAALVLQLSSRKYTAWIYWLTVAMVAVFGTMAADVLHIQLGVPYLVSVVFFGVVPSVTFATWYKYEGSLSIHSIATRKRELFYWATVLATFALGTAAGDMTASTLGLGYFTSAILFAGLIIVPVVGYWKLGMNEILSFWLAYILTRPLGASFADWFGKSQAVSGLGLGDGRVSLVLAILIVAFVGYMTMHDKSNKN